MVTCRITVIGTKSRVRKNSLRIRLSDCITLLNRLQCGHACTLLMTNHTLATWHQPSLLQLASSSIIKFSRILTHRLPACLPLRTENMSLGSVKYHNPYDVLKTILSSFEHGAFGYMYLNVEEVHNSCCRLRFRKLVINFSCVGFNVQLLSAARHAAV